MPNGDNTGPDGKGSKTGRGLGYCNGNEQPGWKSNQPRQRVGRGNGRINRGIFGRFFQR